MTKVDFNLDINKVMEDLRKAKQMGESFAEIVLPEEYKARIKEVWEAYCQAAKDRFPTGLFAIREALGKDPELMIPMYTTGTGIVCSINLDDLSNEYAIRASLEEIFHIPIVLLTNYDLIMRHQK